jgi:hypothetical protein
VLRSLAIDLPKQVVKSSQVKSSQVKIQNGGRLSAAFGAHRWRERSGGQISAQLAPLDSPESGHHHHLLVLDHRGAPGLQHRAFSGSLQYGNATQLQADDGSGRGPARGLLRWSKVSVGSGDRRCRASSARGPSPTSFGVLGLTRARQSFLWPDKSGWRGGGKAIEDVLSECAPHPAHAPYLTHACARATQVPAICHLGAAAEVLRAGERAASSGVRRVGDGAAPGRQQKRGMMQRQT